MNCLNNFHSTCESCFNNCRGTAVVRISSVIGSSRNMVACIWTPTSSRCETSISCLNTNSSSLRVSQPVTYNLILPADSWEAFQDHVRPCGFSKRAVRRAELPEPPRRITYGPDLLTRLFAEDREELTVLPMHYFYAIPDRETTHEFWHAGDLQRAEILKRFESTFTDAEPPYAVHLWGVEGSSQRRVPGEYAESIPSRPI